MVNRLRLIALSSVVAFGLTMNAALAVTVSETTGVATFTVTQKKVTSTVTISFKAGVDQTGAVFGENQTSFAGGFHGNVTCYNLIAPTVAAFGGMITSAADPTLVGLFYVVEVVDPTGTAPDEIGIEITKRPPDCLHVHVQLNPLTSGDLVVH